MPFLPRTCGTEVRGLVQTAFCGNLSLRSTDEKYEKIVILEGFLPPCKVLVTPLGRKTVLLASTRRDLSDKKNRKSLRRRLRVAR